MKKYKSRETEAEPQKECRGNGIEDTGWTEEWACLHAWGTVGGCGCTVCARGREGRNSPKSMSKQRWIRKDLFYGGGKRKVSVPDSKQQDARVDKYDNPERKRKWWKIKASIATAQKDGVVKIRNRARDACTSSKCSGFTANQIKSRKIRRPKPRKGIREQSKQRRTPL